MDEEEPVTEGGQEVLECLEGREPGEDGSGGARHDPRAEGRGGKGRGKVCEGVVAPRGPEGGQGRADAAKDGRRGETGAKGAARRRWRAQVRGKRRM